MEWELLKGVGWAIFLIVLVIFATGYVREQWPAWTARRVQRERERASAAVLQSQRAERSDPPLPAADQPRIAMARWVAHLNNYPDDYPHTLIVGPSRAGKTSIARALLKYRKGEVAIVGTKASANWGDGYVFRSADRAPYLAELRAEVERRLELDTPQPMTIVLDDYATLAAEYKDAVAIFKRVASDGAEKLVRLVITAEGDTVGALGLEGRSYAKSHFVTVRCYQSKQADMFVWSDEAYKFVPQRIDTSAVVQNATPLHAGRFWLPLEQPGVVSQGSGIDQPVSGQGNRSGAYLSVIPPVPDNTTDTDTDAIPATLNADAIRALIAVGWSKNKVAALIRKSKNTALSIIDEALEQTEQAA